MPGLGKEHLLQSPTISEQDAVLVQDVWNGSAEFVGLKAVYEKMSLQDTSPIFEQLYSVITDEQLQIRVAMRYKQIEDFLRANGVPANDRSVSFSEGTINILATLSLQIETVIPQVLETMRSKILSKYGSDQSKADLLISRSTETYLQSYLDSIYYLIATQHLAYIEKYFHWHVNPYFRDLPKATDPFLEAYNAARLPTFNQDFLVLGAQWRNANPHKPEPARFQVDKRKKILDQILSKFPSVIKERWSALNAEPYVYIEIAPRTEKGNIPRQVKKSANDALKRVFELLKKISPGQAVAEMENEDLNQVFQHLEAAKQQVRVHIMAETVDQPLIIHYLLAAMQKNADFQDAVHTIKVRVQGNNEPTAGEILPEIDVYTNKDNLLFILQALQALFADTDGVCKLNSKKPPSFCYNVGRKLLYVTFGDGDIKRALARKGYLNSVFDASKNHAEVIF